jgi:two-component system sensor histidine kinase DegS
VKETLGKIYHWVTAVPRNYHLLIVAVIFAVLVIIHYHETFADIWFLERISSTLEFSLTRQTFGRILFLIPVTYGVSILGIGAGVSILVLSVAAMLPRVFLVSTAPREALFETIGVIFTGLLIILLVDVLHKARQRLVELKIIHKKLDSQIERLSKLYAMSSLVSQSLKLEGVLATINIITELIQTDTSWLYLWDEEKKWLTLAAYKSLPELNLPKIVTLNEEPDGEVARSELPVIVGNAEVESSVMAMPLKQRKLQSTLVVPLISKGKFIGTLGVGSRLSHRFSPDEVDLLRAVADQVSMALENAQLYEKAQSVAEALRVSERNYRELFEGASDAIWVHHLDGKIIAVNSAFERLTGYKRNDLLNTDVSIFLSPHGQNEMEEKAHEAVLKGETIEPHEQKLIKKDGSTVIIQIGTSLITKDGQPWAYQHIARDITEEKKIQDNLKFYIQKVNQAQETERKRIARELHDVTAQALVTIVRNLDDLASGHARFTVKEIQEQARDILREIRRFSQQLRPSVLDDLGLLPAIKWLATELTGNYGIPIDVKVIGEPHQLSPDVELTLFRITQEALTNVQKHSGASSVSVVIEFDNKFTGVTVTDDGKGFEIPERMGDLARSGRLGLVGMQERAQLLGGILIINIKFGKGTTLTVKVPS